MTERNFQLPERWSGRLLADAMAILNEAEDNESLEAIVKVLPCIVRMSLDTRKQLENFLHNYNGWMLTRNTPKIGQTSASSSVMTMKKGTKVRMQNRLEHEVHPMCNELILKIIFSYSSVNDLKNYRMVSKKWHDQSLTFFRKKAVLLAPHLFNGDKQKELVMERASELLGNPFHRYDVDFLNTSLSRENRRVFLEFFSSTIQHLHLYCADLDTLLLVFTTLPELRALTIRLRVDRLLKQYKLLLLNDGRRNSPFPGLKLTTSKLYRFDLQILSTYVNELDDVSFPWKQIFESVSTIKGLAIEYGNWHWPRHLQILEEVLHSLYKARKESNYSILNLEQLDILDLQNPFVQFPVVAAKCILGCRLPLKWLSLDLGQITDLFTFWKILKLHRKTFLYMRCDIRPNITTPIANVINIPSPLCLSSKILLPYLKELVFGSVCLWAFYFLSSMVAPNLENLRIESNMEDNFEKHLYIGLEKKLPNSKGFLRASFLRNLQTFFYEGPRSFSKTELQDLARSMPNVTDLSISLGYNIFPMVYKLWPGLESLRILATAETCSLLNDHAITGIPEVGVDGKVSAENRQSDITKLKNLRKFVLETKYIGTEFARPKKPWVTDLSAVHGFLLLHKLKFLHMETICQFSAAVHVAIVDHIGKVEIIQPEGLK